MFLYIALVSRGKLNCKTVYNGLISDNYHINPAYAKWISKLNISCTLDNWSFYCSLPFKCTDDVQLRIFQYKILHRILPTNALLFKMGYIPDNLCTFCKHDIESLEHLFIHCPRVQPLWVHFVGNVLSRTDLRVIISTEFVLFGINSNKMLNLIIILIKYFIFQAKLKGKIPSVRDMYVHLKKYFNLQKVICKGNLSRNWEKFWLPWYDLLCNNC